MFNIERKSITCDWYGRFFDALTLFSRRVKESYDLRIVR